MTDLEIENQNFTFAEVTNRRVLPSIDLLKITPDEEGKQCRICLEIDLQDKLIRPCKCAGSVKFVHEECLKTWLVSLNKELSKSKCEICATSYKMNFVIKRKCLPRESCKNGAAHCFFIPILISVIVMLFLIIYLLAQKYLVGSSTTEQKAYTIALTVTCLIAGIIIIGLLVNSIKESCYSSKMETWQIMSQVFQEEIEIDEKGLVKLEEIRKRPLVIPKKLKVNGKNVRAPELRPMMTPVSRRGRVVAFSPKYLTPVHSKLGERSIELENQVFKY